MVIHRKRAFTLVFIILSMLMIPQQILKSRILVSGSDGGVVVLSNDEMSVSHSGVGIGYLNYPLDQSLLPTFYTLPVIKYNNTLLPPVPLSASGLELITPATRIGPYASKSVMRTTDQLTNVTMLVTLSSSSPSGSIVWNIANIGTKLLSDVSFYERGFFFDYNCRSYGSYTSGSVDKITLSLTSGVLELYSTTSSMSHDFCSCPSSSPLVELGRIGGGLMNGLNHYGPDDISFARKWTVGLLHPGEKWSLTVHFKATVAMGYEVSPTNSQTLTLEKSQKSNQVSMSALFVTDVDGDGIQEILTGGSNSSKAQLGIWSCNGSTMTLEKIQEWNATYPSYSLVNSIFAADIDVDGKKEIITGGSTKDLRNVSYPQNVFHSQLLIWNWDGNTLTLKKSMEWCDV